MRVPFSYQTTTDLLRTSPVEIAVSTFSAITFVSPVAVLHTQIVLSSVVERSPSLSQV